MITSKNIKPLTKSDKLLEKFITNGSDDYSDGEKLPIVKKEEINGEEIITMTCPYCGSVVKDFYRANGPDDYSKDAECVGCGSYWSA